MYNSLVKLNERVNQAWAGIVNQLKRRADLFKNLDEPIKAYAKHEKGLYENIAESRAKMMGARTVQSVAEADRSMLGTLSRIMAISENYPDLKADEGFQKVMEEIRDTEDKITASRTFYNAGVEAINSRIKVFPFNILFHKFKERDYYEVDEATFAKLDEAPELKLS